MSYAEIVFTSLGFLAGLCLGHPWGWGRGFDRGVVQGRKAAIKESIDLVERSLREL